MSREGISKFIFVNMAEPDIGEMERSNLNEAIIPGDIGKGNFIPRFEESWALYNRYRFGVATNSGTSALHLAVKASGAKHIAVSNFTMAATAWAGLYENINVDYIPTRKDLPLSKYDVDLSIYDAVIFAHIFGRKAYPDGYPALLKKKYPNLIVIDDMAQAHGIFPEGDIACYSFYANKILTTGEGGMCLTQNEDLANKIRFYGDMAFDEERSMIHDEIGHNYRMTNLQAAIGLAQTERVDFILEKRREIAAWYRKHLPESVLLPESEVLWYYDIKVPNAEKTQKYLKSQGCASRRFFYPLSVQPWGNGMNDKWALKWYKHGLLLPTHNNMVEGDVKWIAELVRHSVSKYKKAVVF